MRLVRLLTALALAIALGALLATGEWRCPAGHSPAAVAPSGALTVVETFPAHRAVAVPRGTRVRLTFDRDLDTATLAGAVSVRYPCAAAAITAAVLPAVTGRYDPELRSLFIETAFIPDEEAEVEVAATAAGLDGARLARPYRLRFMVEADPAAAWRHELVLNQYGTQRIGKLWYSDREVPPAAGTITTPAGIYQYRRAPEGEGDTGWVFADRPPAWQSEVDPELAADELKAGRYPAPPAGRRRGTPIDWVHLSLPDRAYWIDPRQLTGTPAAGGW